MLHAPEYCRLAGPSAACVKPGALWPSRPLLPRKTLTGPAACSGTPGRSKLKSSSTEADQTMCPLHLPVWCTGWLPAADWTLAGLAVLSGSRCMALSTVRGPVLQAGSSCLCLRHPQRPIWLY